MMVCVRQHIMMAGIERERDKRSVDRLIQKKAKRQVIGLNIVRGVARSLGLTTSHTQKL